jgi:hypothetical protein
MSKQDNSADEQDPNNSNMESIADGIVLNEAHECCGSGCGQISKTREDCRKHEQFCQKVTNAQRRMYGIPMPEYK